MVDGTSFGTLCILESYRAAAYQYFADAIHAAKSNNNKMNIYLVFPPLIYILYNCFSTLIFHRNDFYGF